MTCSPDAAAATATATADASTPPPPAAPTSALDSVCFNQLQVLGTHNSYHVAPPDAIVQRFDGSSAGDGPLSAWQQSMPSLTAQLDAGGWAS